jgi:hypothetical protein
VEAIVIAFKFLRAEGATVFSPFRWPLPDGEPGEWVEAPVIPCRSGIHACRPDDLPYWLAPLLFEIELDGEIVEHTRKVVAPRGRLLRRLRAWEDELSVAFTHDCARRAHEIARADPSLAAWDAGIDPSIPEGPAMLGFMAAAIAEQEGGMAAYRAERARQAAWLTERLSLARGETRE